MGCCGSKRQQLVQKIYGSQGMRAQAEQAAQAPAPAPHFATPPGVPFVYDGMAELVVTGGATGRRYRFAARGARLIVDPLDAPAMRQMPKLRCLG